MALHPASLGELVAAARSATEPPWPVWPPVVVRVELDAPVVDAPPLPWWWTAVVVGISPDPADDPPALCDVVVADGADVDVDAIEATVTSNPLASTALATLLRGAAERSTSEGLLAESAVYSTLQAGPEFAAWRASRPARERTDAGPRVRVERDGDALHITLTRAAVRNAFDTAMRDQLVEGLQLAALDDSIAEVHLRGEGPTFCTGGDLDEFGARPDPATAHLVRMLQSGGRAIDTVADRVTGHIQSALALH